MKLDCAVFPEARRPLRGLYTVWNPEAVATGEKNITLCCGRGGSAAALVALAPRDGGAIISLTDAPVFTHHRGPDGKALPVVRPRPVFDGPLTVSMSNILFHPCDDNLERADALDTAPVQYVRPGGTGWVYVEIAAPEDAPRGEYTVDLRMVVSEMFADEYDAGNITAKLTVYGTRIPENRELPFYLDLWQHPAGIARAHRVGLWSEEHFALLEKYAASLAELGQKCVTVIASDCPWSGQWCHFEERADADLYEYSMIRTVRGEDGTFTYDYSVMQRYIDLCARCGISDEITVFGLVNVWCDKVGGFSRLAPDHPDGAKLRYFDRADGKYKYMRRAGDIDGYVAALEQYFVRTGQMERVRLMADEPADTEKYRLSIDRVRAVAPAFKLKAALNHSEFIAEFGDRVSDFVPSLECLCREYDKIKEYQATMPGKRFLWYVCNQPARPNTFLESDPCETLFIGALTAALGMDGFLRWGYTVWCPDPVKDNRYFNWPAGDLHLVYPAPSGDVMLSLRYKLLKRAVTLAGLLRRYGEEQGQEALEKAVSGVIKCSDPRGFFPPDGTARPAPLPRAKMMSENSDDYQELLAFLLSCFEGK